MSLNKTKQIMLYYLSIFVYKKINKARPSIVCENSAGTFLINTVSINISLNGDIWLSLHLYIIACWNMANLPTLVSYSHFKY